MDISACLLADVLRALDGQHGNENISPKQLELIRVGIRFLSAAYKAGTFDYKGIPYNRLATAFDAIREAIPPEPTEVCPD